MCCRHQKPGNYGKIFVLDSLVELLLCGMLVAVEKVDATYQWFQTIMTDLWSS